MRTIFRLAKPAFFRYNENYALERDLFVTDFGKTGNTSRMLRPSGSIKVGPGLGSTSMQIVRDARIKKTNGNGGNLYGDT